MYTLSLSGTQSEIQVAGQGALKHFMGDNTPVTATTRKMLESF